MRFMDLLFKRYASPFLLLDQMIQTGCLYDFVMQFIDTVNDDNIYDVWVHKIFDKSFKEFKESVMKQNTPKKIVPEYEVKEIAKESQSILENFVPL